MKENVTLSDLKAGDKLICTNLEYIQRFKVGKEYEVKEGEFGLFIENEHKVPIYIELNIKAFSECFSLLTPQQPERLLTEADYTCYNDLRCKEQCSVCKYVEKELNNDNYNNRCKYELCVENYFNIKIREKETHLINVDVSLLVDMLCAFDTDKNFKLISQTAQKEVNGQDEQSFYEFIYDTIDEVLYGAKSTSVGIALIDQAVKKEVFQKTSLLQQEVEKLRELLKESKRFCGGSLQAKIDNQLNK